MSGKNKKKKSTTQYKSAGFLIPAIAILETIVLIAVSSFAWYFYSTEKKLSSAIVTVNADSGLDIDFKDADNTNYIDVWRYLDREDFEFEPASSVDGREIFFPTSGTFGSDDTNSMVFREGTGNDVNSKYVSIDFKLTNTSSAPMDVYLSGRSQFTINDESHNREVGKALRLALYTNDGSSGRIGSNFTSLHTSQLHTTTQETTNTTDMVTVYFEKGSGWGSTVYAYAYDDNDASTTITYYEADGTTVNSTAARGSGDRVLQTWPGQACTWISGNLYAYTFYNPRLSKKITTYDADGRASDTIVYSDTRMYDKIIFSDGGSNQTENYGFKLHNDIENKYLYPYNGAATVSGETVTLYPGKQSTLSTVYFLKPDDWTADRPNCRPSKSGNSGYYNDGAGASMEYVTTGIYSYTFPRYLKDESGAAVSDSDNYTYLFFKDVNTNKQSMVQQFSIDSISGKLYYFPATSVGATSSKLYTTTYSTSNIYFYKNARWANVITPYAFVNAFADVVGKYTYSIPMTDLGDNLYFCEVPDVFLKDVMSTRTDVVNDSGTTIAQSGLANNCRVYFGNAASGPSEVTETVDAQTKYIYVASPSDTTSPYDITYDDYNSYLPSTGSSYAVMAPGVSAGFQRSASAVYSIDNVTGSYTKILPSFASSFDDYIMGSGNPLFRIAEGHTVNMSMIIWLEGTDSHCTAENYAGKNIELYLELATEVTEKDNGNYTYQFVDATKEIWTSDTTRTVSGIEVNPVMQMYDVTADHGYLMKPKAYNNGKVSLRECNAPQLLTYEGTQHVIEFRRVNPVNEEEIWNRWQAGNLPTYRQYALDVNTHTVTYTALGDTGPRTAQDTEGNMISDMPATASAGGGLWGNINTEMLYVYDGRKVDTRANYSIVGNAGTGNQANLFIKYTYNYGGGVSQTIEYKCSNEENFYYFVVPSAIFEKQPNIVFSNYIFKADKAANDYASQGDDVVRRFYINAGNCIGRFYELNESYDNPAANGYAPDNCYWGSDIVYIQGPADSSKYLSVSYSSQGPGHNDNSYMRAVFCRSGYSIDTDDTVSDEMAGYDDYSITAYRNNTHIVYLYDDKQNSNSGRYNYVAATSEGRIPSFAAVVPCDASYDKYGIYRVITEYEEEYDETWYYVSRSAYPISLTTTTVGSVYMNTVSDNILYLKNDYKIIYIPDANPDPEIDLGDGEFKSRGELDYGSDGTYLRFTVPSDAQIRFRFRHINNSNPPVSQTFVPQDGRLYYYNGSGRIDNNHAASDHGLTEYNDYIETSIDTVSKPAPSDWPQVLSQTGPG